MRMPQRRKKRQTKSNLSRDDQARLDQFKEKERARRLRFASQIRSKDFGKAAFSSFAHRLCIRRRELRTWIRNFESQGEAGLEPDWGELPGDEALHQAEKWLTQLGEFANAEKITNDDVKELMRRNGWSLRQTERRLESYRTGGLFGLTPTYNPYKPHRKANKSSASITPNEAALAQAIKASDRLGGLIEKERAKTTTTRDVQRRAKESGEVERTLWNNLSKYREGGYIGLARKTRSDKGL